MDDVEIDELPPLSYQLLLFSKKGHQEEILKGIADHFNKLDEIYKKNKKNSSQQNVKQLRHIEGTIILHIDLAIKRDQVSLQKKEKGLYFCFSFSLRLSF